MRRSISSGGSFFRFPLKTSIGGLAGFSSDCFGFLLAPVPSGPWFGARLLHQSDHHRGFTNIPISARSRWTAASRRSGSITACSSRLCRGIRAATKNRQPSRRSLREMPEADFTKMKVRRNPYAHRIASEGMSIHAGRGRPKKGFETGPTLPCGPRRSRGSANLGRESSARGALQWTP